MFEKMDLIFFCLFGLFATSTLAVTRDKVFILQSPEDGKKVAVVTWFEQSADGEENNFACETFRNEEVIDQILRESNNQVVLQPSPDEFEDLLDECSIFYLRRRKRGLFYSNFKEEEEENNAPKNRKTTASSGGTTSSEGYDGWNIIFPGTKWCGPGDISKHYHDLGIHQDTDRCCRAHDLCNDTLAPGETRNEITNTWPFTKLSCKCDNDFYDCLSRVNTVTSNTIGNTYFNVARRSCYAKEHPMSKKCKKYFSFLKLKCIEFARDTSKPQVYQWIPSKTYKKLPIPGPLDITLPF